MSYDSEDAPPTTPLPPLVEGVWREHPSMPWHELTLGGYHAWVLVLTNVCRFTIARPGQLHAVRGQVRASPAVARAIAESIVRQLCNAGHDPLFATTPDHEEPLPLPPEKTP